MDSRRFLAGSAIALLIVAAAAIVRAQQPLDPGRERPGADLILTNGKIITVDEKFTIAQALAVRGNRIVAVGTNQQITQMATTTTRRIDLRGRAVVPGLIDNHMHLLRAGTTWTREVRFDGVETRGRRSTWWRRAPRRFRPATGCTTSVAGRSISSPTAAPNSRARSSIASLRTIRSRSRS